MDNNIRRMAPYRYEEVAGREEEEKAVDIDGDQEFGAQLNAMTNSATANTATGSRKFLYIAVCAGNLATFTAGITLGWTSPEIPKLYQREDNPLGAPITQAEEGWIGSLLPLGASLGPFAAGIAADKFGRKMTLLVGNMPFVISLLLNFFATNVVYFYVSRFLTGLAVGATFTVLPMYIGEISEDENRGALGTFLQLFCTIGLLFSYTLGPFVSIKVFNLACLIVPVAFLILFFMFIPESPYYLVAKGDMKEAENALVKLREKSNEGVQKELEIIKTSVDEALANKAGFLDLFKSRGLVKALMLGFGLLGFQQLSGINVILFYAQGIFTDAGVSLSPAICTIIIGIVQVISSGASSALIEKKGKRLLLMVSSIGMAVSQAVLAYFFYLKDDKHSDVSAISWLPIACLIVYIITYCLGFGPIPWALVGELFPANVKSIASTAVASNCWFTAYALTKHFSSVADVIGKSGSFGIFAGSCGLAFLFVFLCVPETTGKSLQEIQDILNGKKPENDSSNKE